MGAPTGSYSRNMFSEVKSYVMRSVQQGIPWVDADDNDAQQMHYQLMRRIEEILGDGAVGDGFLCSQTGSVNDFDVLGGDGTADGAGRFFLHGHQAHIFGSTTYRNDGSTEDGKSIHPRITALQYNSGPGESLLTDSAANWGVNEHAGKTITPDITQSGSTFTIVSNTATQMTITGDITTVAQVGDNYRIELTTPSGSDRSDGVFLNVYIDEYDCTDDPNLVHTLTTSVCAQLRYKMIQTLYVQEGAETFSDYVDSDGNQHFVFEVARLNRQDGVSTIDDITDLRPMLNDGHTSYWHLFLLNNNLRVVTSDPDANTVDVLPGWWTLSDRSALKKFPTQTTSPTFDPIVTPGNVRYDLISLADNATLSIVQGSEIAGPGDPFADGPPPEGNKLALAFVRITEDTTVVVDEDDITDAREFLNIGLGTDALSNYYAALWLRPHEQDTPDDTIRIEPGRYVDSSRSAMINKASAFNSGSFAVVGTPGNVRYDLVMMDDSGNPQIVQGTEVAGPGDPFTDSPSPDNDKLLVAIVKVDETATVVIDAADVTDAREFLNSGGALGTKVTQSELDIYRPHEQSVPDDTVRIEAGQHIQSDGISAVIVPAAFNSGSFAVVAPGFERYDLLAIDDSGNPQITAGTPVAISTGDPLTDAPPIPLNQLAVAIVKVDENATVVVNTADITDIREFLNKGGSLDVQDEGISQGQASSLDFVGPGVSASVAGGVATITIAGTLLAVEDEGVPQGNAGTMNFTGTGVTATVAAGVATVDITGGGGGGATQLYEKQIAAGGQTVFDLTVGTYVVGSDTLFVFRNGKKLVKITEYTETDADTVTLANPAIAGDVFEFIVPAAGNGEGECYKRDDFVATAGQTTFTTSNTAPPEVTNTMVLSGGVLMVHGATEDYTFSGNDVVFNTPRVLGEKVAVIKVLCGAGGGGGGGGGLVNYDKQVATAGQTIFDLTFTYVVGDGGLFVVVNGVKQILTTDYVETDSDTVTFGAGLVSGDIVEFIYFDSVTPRGLLTYEKQIATPNQSIFNIAFAYSIGDHGLVVTRNGNVQTVGTDYTETGSQQVTFTSGLLSGDIVEFRNFVDADILTPHNISYHPDAAEVMAPGQTYRNLVIQGLDTNTVGINPDSVVLADDWVHAIEVPGGGVAIDITTTGAGGLDTGAEAGNTWYFIWLIKNDSSGTVSGLFSTSMTSPTMPPGYTLKRLVGATYNDGSLDLRPFHQKDAQVYQAAEVVAAFITAPVWSPIDLSAAIPVPISGEYEFNVSAMDNIADPTDDVYINLAADPLGVIGFQEHGMMDAVSVATGPFPHEKWISSTDSLMNIDGFAYFQAPGDPDNIFLSIFGFELQI